MKKRLRHKPRSTSGFTLIEVLVVIIIIGILFAIAAPGWDTFLSRQRVSAAREQILQVIRQTQSEARTTRSPRVVAFDFTPGSIPRVGSAPYRTGTAPESNVTNWLTLGNGELNPNSIRLASTAKAIVFDSNGAVAVPPLVSDNQFKTTLPNQPTTGFVITVARGNVTSQATDRCIIINTLLGGLTQGEGAASDARGCPAL